MSRHIAWHKVLSALFFAFSSFFIVISNKQTLTTYKFPSFQFLALGQMIATIVVLYVAKLLKIIDFPSMSRDVPRKIWPLPLIYCGNLVFGLGATKHINLPMFTVLRRFSVVMTMYGEQLFLGAKPPLIIQLSVWSMIAGALVAISSDLAFNLLGYYYVTMNNIFTASNNIVTKKKLDSKDFGKNGLIFYNAVFMFPIILAYNLYGAHIQQALSFPGWSNPVFVCYFLMSCFAGFVLNYSIVLCTQHNSALTTTIVGTLKNMLTTYVGLFIGGDYVYSLQNFIGLNVSVAGSLVYSYLSFTDKDSPKNSPAPLSENGVVATNEESRTKLAHV